MSELKKSRPDIQVLEERIVRLKAQLEEFSKLKLYETTRRRIKKVSQGLEECASLARSIAGDVTVPSDRSSYSSDRDAEFTSDSDLSDTRLFHIANSKPVPEHYVMSVSRGAEKDTVLSVFANRTKRCVNDLGASSGILQVNQFCFLLDSWFYHRFVSPNRNPEFHFKVDRIREWINLLILGAGQALHQGCYPDFLAGMDEWIGDLSKPCGSPWALPYSLIKIKQQPPSIQYTAEATMIEKMVKPFLYDSSFYPSELHFIEHSEIESGLFSASALKLEAIISANPNLIRTASFDVSRFEKEA